jgi:hypothetical protein
MGKTILIGGQRAVDPPIWMLNDSVMSPVRNFPGGVTIFDSNDQSSQAPVGVFPVSTNIPLGRDMQQDYREQVEAAFFKNVFNLPVDGPEMTATEVVERKEQFVRVLGPVFGRQETDYIGKVVERTFGIMSRAGAFLPMPEIMLEAEVDFRYQSPIQRARKQLEISALSASLQQLAPLAGAQPEILDNFDGDAVTRDAPEWSGLPFKWLKSKDAVAAIRQSRAEQQQQEELTVASQPVSQAVKNIAQAGKLESETPI